MLIMIKYKFNWDIGNFLFNKEKEPLRIWSKSFYNLKCQNLGDRLQKWHEGQYPCGMAQPSTYKGPFIHDEWVYLH